MQSQEINKFIGQHSVWKSRLRQAIDSGNSLEDSANVRRDDQCDFGKWLKSLPPHERSQHFQTVSSLHADFHREAAHVLELVASGKKAEAEKSLGSSGAFTAASTKLTQEMAAWKKDV